MAGVALEVATALPRAEDWLAAIAFILYEGAEAGVNMLICALYGLGGAAYMYLVAVMLGTADWDPKDILVCCADLIEPDNLLADIVMEGFSSIGLVAVRVFSVLG